MFYVCLSCCLFEYGEPPGIGKIFDKMADIAVELSYGYEPNVCDNSAYTVGNMPTRTHTPYNIDAQHDSFWKQDEDTRAQLHAAHTSCTLTHTPITTGSTVGSTVTKV